MANGKRFVVIIKKINFLTQLKKIYNEYNRTSQPIFQKLLQVKEIIISANSTDKTTDLNILRNSCKSF